MGLLASALPPRRLHRREPRRSSPGGFFPLGEGRGGASRGHRRGGNRGAALRLLGGQPRGRTEAPAAADGGRAAGAGGGRPPWRAAGPRPPSTWSGCTTSSARCTRTSAAPRSDCATEPPVGAAAGGGRARGGAAALSGPERPRAARPRLTAPQLGRGRGRGRARGLRWGRGLRRAPGNRVKERGMARTALGGTARRSPAGRCAGAVELGQGSPELCCARARSSELWARTGCLQAAFFQCL